MPDPEALSREQLVAEVLRLRSQSASLAEMFEQAPSFIALLGGPEHRFTLTNAAYQRAIDHRDVVGRTVAEALPDAAAQGYVDLLDEVFRSGRTHRATGSRYDVQATPGGPVHERYLDFIYQPITDADGAVTGIFVEGHDVTERTRGEVALGENEARYRTLFESIEVGFCIIEMRFEGDRAVDYRIVEANPAFVRQTGADVAGKWVSEFAPDLERHWFDTYGGVAQTGAPAHFEHYAEVFGRWFDVRALRTGEPGANRVAVFFSDITERRSMEKRAEAGERELRLITDALPVLISFIDAGYVYRFANQAYDDWFFMPPEQVVGQDVRVLLGPEGYAARKPFMDQALSGEAVTFELDWPQRDGRPRVAEIRYLPRRTADARVDGFHVFVQDVTARKQTEAELARQVAARTAERDRIWQATSDMLCVANLDGYFVSLNPAWPSKLGWTDAEMKARPFLDFVHPDDVAPTLKAANGLARGEAQTTFENRYRHKDGRYLWLSWNAVPRDGLVYASVRDVTEIKEQAEVLRLTEEALRQSQKMEAVGHLTGGLAHDFNNLLAGISGSLELMQTRMTQGRLGDLDRYMTVAQGAAKRAAALTHRLLAFSRRQTLDPKPTNVNRLVTDWRSSSGERSGRRSTWRPSVSPGYVRDVGGIRDRIKGTFALQGDTGSRNAARVGAMVRDANSILDLGGSVLSSIPDIAGAVFRWGFGNVLGGAYAPWLKGLAGQSTAWAGAKAELKALGLASEMALATRSVALDELSAGWQPTSRLERGVHMFAEKFQVLNLQAPWTDWTKTVAGISSMNAILQAAERVRLGRATAKDLSDLAASNIEASMAVRIRDQFDRSGRIIDEVHLPNTADWIDRDARLAFEQAVRREVNIAVVTPGQEKPLWLSRPLLGLFGQHKSFVFASTQRIMRANLQRRDANTLAGLVTAISAGGISAAAYALAADRPLPGTPSEWMKESIARSGILGWLDEANTMAAKATRGQADMYRLIGADKPLSKFSANSITDMLAGPTAGKVQALQGVLGAPFSEEGWSARDTQSARRLIPAQNLVYIRRLFNEVEDGLNRSIGVEPMERGMEPRP